MNRRGLTRAVLPQLMLRAVHTRQGLHARWTRLRSTLGAAPRVELYFAFDDPYGAIAGPALLALCERRRAELIVFPVVARGFDDDPDRDLRRAYALTDSQRLLARSGAKLARRSAVEPESVRFLAAWTAAIDEQRLAAAFAAAALSELWLVDDAAIDPGRYRQLYERVVGATPPTDVASLAARLAHNAEQLRARGHWETPAALIAGQWFFAHERLPQMDELLGQLGR